MVRRPISKNCRFCGKFMELWWVEIGSRAWQDATVKGVPFDWGGESIIPLFFCVPCNEWDNEFVNPKHYEWLLYKGTIDFSEAKKELPRSEYLALSDDYREMKRLFLNRPLLAIPKLE